MGDQLEHLIFDEHKLISYKWVTNHFKIHIQKSKQILSLFVNKHENKLFIHHCISGYKQITIKHQNPYDSEYKSPKKSKKKENSNNSNTNNSYDSDDDDDDINMESVNDDLSSKTSVFTILIVPHSQLKEIKCSFDSVQNIHVHSIAIKQSEQIGDFYQAQYETDYAQQLNVMTSFLSAQSLNNHNNNKSVQDISRFSNIHNNQTQTVSSPHLHRALARTKQEKKNKNDQKNKNDKNKKMSFDDKIEKNGEK